MEPTTVRLDDTTQAIVDAKAAEIAAIMGGNPKRYSSAAIRAILKEWDWLRSIGCADKAQVAK